MPDQNLDKEWADAEKALAKRRKEKREALLLQMGIAAIILIDEMNHFPVPTPEQAEAKWNAISKHKKAKYLYLADLYSPIAPERPVAQ